MHYVAKREDLEWTARDLFKAIGNNILDANINYEYALKDAVKAHEAIESGTTIGATVLIPWVTNYCPCSMDYGQWADHPLTIDQYWLGKGCSNPGPWTVFTVDKVVDKLFTIDGLTVFAKLLILLEFR